MNILKITKFNEEMHITYEAGQQGKNNMMMKINRFLTKDLRAKNIELQNEVDAHNNANDNVILHETIKNLLINISFNNHKIDKIMNVATIAKYNELHDIEVKMITVE